MNGQAITFASGIVLLILFALVGVYARRRRRREEAGEPRDRSGRTR